MRCKTILLVISPLIDQSRTLFSASYRLDNKLTFFSLLKSDSTTVCWILFKIRPALLNISEVRHVGLLQYDRMTFLTKVEVIEMSEKSATKIAGEVQVASEDCLGQPLPRAA